MLAAWQQTAVSSRGAVMSESVAPAATTAAAIDVVDCTLYLPTLFRL